MADQPDWGIIERSGLVSREKHEAHSAAKSPGSSEY
jgi:hypothetical protein